MKIQEFFDKDTSTLTYVAYAGPDAVVIDPVLNFDPASGKISESSVQAVGQFLRGQNLTLHWILETHAHADHISGAQKLKLLNSSTKLGIGEGIRQVQAIFAKIFHQSIPTDGSQFDRLFKDGESMQAGQLQIRMHSTPGHTPACMSYEIQGHLFTGDSIFMPDSGTGRCDFPGGSAEALYRSIHEKLYAFPPNTAMYVGHDYQPNGRSLQFKTTVGEQMEKNIHLKASTTQADFVQFRKTRDQTLSAPKLLLPSIQVNIDAGRLPPPESNGTRYLKLPLSES